MQHGSTQTLESVFATTADHLAFTDRAACSALAGDGWATSAFAQYGGLDFNYLLTDDGAVLASGPAEEQVRTAPADLGCSARPLRRH